MNRKHFLGLLSLTPLLFAMKNINELFSYKDILPNTAKMPVLFLGHGSPMNAIEENEFVAGFRNIAKTFLLQLQFYVFLRIGSRKAQK